VDPSGCGSLDAERDGGYPVRTNPAHLWPDLWASYRSVTIGIGTYGAPTGRPTGRFKPEIPGSRARASCRLNKIQQSNIQPNKQQPRNKTWRGKNGHRCKVLARSFDFILNSFLWNSEHVISIVHPGSPKHHSSLNHNLPRPRN
jgi:hypothetical protein